MEDKATFAHRPVNVGKERLVHIQRDEFNLDLDDRLSTQAHGARHEDAFVACFEKERGGRATGESRHQCSFGVAALAHHMLEQLCRPLYYCQLPTLHVYLEPVDRAHLIAQ